MLFTLNLRGPQTDPAYWLHDPESLTWKAVQQAFSALGEISRQRQVPIVLLIFPEPDYSHLDPYPFEGIHQQVREEGEKNGFVVLDLLPLFREEHPERLRVSPEDGHPSPYAHALIAQQIFPLVLELLQADL